MQNPALGCIKNEVFKCEDTLEKYSCEYCNFKTDLRTILQEHIQIALHNNLQINSDKYNFYTCNKCCFTSYSSLFWYRHKIHCTPNADFLTQKKCELFACSHCAFYTKFEPSLKSHFLTKHAEPDQGKFRCSKCDYKAITEFYLNQHMKYTHEEKLISPAFVQSLQTQNKEEPCFSHETKLYECSFCIYKTKLYHHMLRHVKCKHGCKFCDYASNGRDDLKEHYSTHHPQNIYKCLQCSYNTKLKNDLRDHIAKYHKESMVSLVCNYCSFKTIYKKSLKAHISSQHSGNDGGSKSNTSCKICNYKPNGGDDLEQHYLTYHPENMFNCFLCSYKTIIELQLKYHIYKTHRT